MVRECALGTAAAGTGAGAGAGASFATVSGILLEKLGWVGTILVDTMNGRNRNRHHPPTAVTRFSPHTICGPDGPKEIVALVCGERAVSRSSVEPLYQNISTSNSTTPERNVNVAEHEF